MTNTSETWHSLHLIEGQLKAVADGLRYLTQKDLTTIKGDLNTYEWQELIEEIERVRRHVVTWKDAKR